MTKPPPTWLGDEQDEDRPAGRRWVLVGLATLPWLVVVTLLLTGVTPGGGAATSEVAHPVPASGEAPQQADVTTDSPSDGGPEDPEGGANVTADAGALSPTTPAGADGHAVGPAMMDPAVAALAKAVARAWLTDVGPRLQIEGIEPQADRYLEQAMVEAVDVHDGLAVATVLALVLERDGERYVDVALQRLAVPVRLTDAGPRPAGQPWWLPDADVRPHPPEPTPDDDPDLALAVTELLAEHDYDDVELTQLARHGGGWLIAEVSARLPDGRQLLGPVWLRETPRGPRLLGGTADARGQGGPEPPGPIGDHQAPTPDPDHHEEQR
jgi:hypothetical protein